MPLRFEYEFGLQGELTDITDRVRLYTFDGTENAEEGSVAVSSITIDDPDGDLDIVGWRTINVYEDAATGSNTLTHRGWIAERRVTRGPSMLTGDARIWDVSLADMNALLHMRVLNNPNADRPAETDVQRIQWLMSIAEMNRITGTAFISTASPKNMDENDYRGQTLYDVINDCAQQSGKNFFVGTDQGAAVRFLWYDFASSTAYSSPIRLSNVASDISIPTDSSYYALVRANGPAAYWRLGEASGTVAADALGTNNGTYVNTPTLGVAGLVPNDTNTAVTFTSASSEYITVPDHASLDLGDVLTIEMWVKPTTIGFSYLMNKGSGSYALYMDGSGVLHFYMSGIGDLAHSSISLVAGSTYHVVCTKSGATRKIYINGVDRTTLDSNNTLGNTATQLVIGADDALGNPWNGTLDEVALYPTALTAAQVSAHYAGPTDDQWTFAIAEDTTLTRDPSRVYSGAYVRFDGGSVYEEDFSISNQFTRRDAVYDASNVKHAATATRRALRYLSQSGDEEDRISTAVWLPAPKANMIKPGMRVQFKASHLPGYTSFVWARVLQRKVKQVSENDTLLGPAHLISLELSVTPTGVVGGTCSTSGGSLTIKTFPHADVPSAKWRVYTGPDFDHLTLRFSNLSAGDFDMTVAAGQCCVYLEGESGGQGVPFDGVTWTPTGGEATYYPENGDGLGGHFFQYDNSVPNSFTADPSLWNFPVYGYTNGGRTGDYGLGLNNGVAFVLP